MSKEDIINDLKPDQLRTTYRYSLKNEWPTITHTTLNYGPFSKDPTGYFYIDLSKYRTTVYGMVELNKYATVDNIIRFLRCLLSRNTFFHSMIQKDIPDDWTEDVRVNFTNQTEDHLWIKLRVLREN